MARRKILSAAVVLAGGLLALGGAAGARQAQSAAPNSPQQRKFQKPETSPIMRGHVPMHPGAEEKPMAPPQVLYIEHQWVRPGAASANERMAGQLTKLVEKAQWPLHYVTMSAVAGYEGEYLFLTAFGSFADMDKAFAAVGKSPKDLLEELSRIHLVDGSIEIRSQKMLAVFRPDLSYRADLAAVARAHYLEVDFYQVKFEQMQAYERDARFLMTAYRSAGIDAHYFVYDILSGAPAPMYMVVRPLASLGEMDGMRQEWMKAAQSEGAEGEQRMDKLFDGCCVQSSGEEGMPVLRVFALRPDLSHVSGDFAAVNPDFWNPPAPAQPPQRESKTPKP